MKLILEGEGRKYEAECNNIEELYDAIRDGCIAMSYSQFTVDKYFPIDEE